VKVQIKLLATYGRYLPPGTESSSYETEIPEGTRVEDLLRRLPLPPNHASVVLVNGRGPEPEQVLQEGDVVCLFPAMAGG
jgi:sulfur carrier protein ThiS